MRFDLRMVVAVSVVANLWQLLEHSSVPIIFPGWFAELVITPDTHRHHHAFGHHEPRPGADPSGSTAAPHPD